jgi:uncharacterized iron-regulated membrane protein
MSIRTAFLKLHLWVGLTAAILVLLLAVSGTILVFENEIDRALNPKLLFVPAQPANLPVAELVDRIRKQMPGRVVVNVGLNSRPDLAWQVILGGRGALWAYVNPHTGEITGTRDRTKTLMNKVHQFHMNLLLGKKGEIWVGAGNACLMFLMITGLVLWWKRKMLTVEMAGSWKRINFDLHHVSGIYSFVILFVIVGTGLLMSFPNQMYPIVEAFTGDMSKDQPEEKPVSTPPAQKGVAGITPDQALAIGAAQLPGASPAYMSLPLGPKAVYEIGYKYPEDRTPGGRSRVVIERYTGEALWVDDGRKVSRGAKFSNQVRSLHTGDIYGWPSRILYALGSFSVVIQAFTGVIIWGLRFFRRKSASEVPKAPVESVA